MATCTFCSARIEQGTGKMVVDRTGKVMWFDSAKCEKNAIKLGRDARNFKWAKNNG
jgi:large subunit ribosomal protein L24e